MASARDLSAEMLLRLDRSGGRLDLGAARDRLPDPRERGLLTELTLGCVRRRGTLDAVLGIASKRPVRRLNAAVRVALRLGLYQVLFLDRVPGHAAVDHAVGWARGHAGPRRAGFVNGVLRSLLRDLEGVAAGSEKPRKDVPREDGSALRFRRSVFPDPATNLAGSLAARFSMPQWLVERWLEAFGEVRTAQVLRAGIRRPPVTLRARGDRAALAERLRAQDVRFEEGPGPQALRLAEGEAAVRLAVIGDEVTVQDATSQRVAALLAPQAGEAVLDVCAAPGGKSLHLADLMGTGRLVACDVEDAKLALLQELAPRMGAVAYETVRIDPSAPLPFAPASFDAILVDAPCSNTGVLARRVEARWRLKPEDLTALAALQRDLLERCLPMLAPGGRIVYSTCSIEREENEGVVEAFAAAHPELRLEPGFRAWPRSEADGGFAAVLRLTA